MLNFSISFRHAGIAVVIVNVKMRILDKKNREEKRVDC